MGMDGSRWIWIWVIGSAFSPYSRYLRSDLDVFVVCTTGSFDLTVCVTFYSMMMLSKDFFRRYWYYSSSAFSSFSSSRNRPFAEDTWRREFTCMHKVGILLFCRDCGDSLSG